MAVRARELPALLFALVWLLGYEVVPLAHVAMHAQLAPHSHGVTTHCHGALCHADDEGASKSSPASHGQGSLEHRGVAALPHELTIFVPERMLAGEMPREAAHEARVSSFERVSPPARAPPA